MTDQIVITDGVVVEISRHEGLKIPWRLPYGCKSHHPYQMPSYTVSRSGAHCKCVVL